MGVEGNDGAEGAEGRVVVRGRPCPFDKDPEAEELAGECVGYSACLESGDAGDPGAGGKGPDGVGP